MLRKKNVSWPVESAAKFIESPTNSKTYILTVHGQLPSGKNQIRIAVRHGRIQKYPDKRFVDWRAIVLQQWASLVSLPDQPITHPVQLDVAYWPGDRRTRDVSGMLDALFHVLVKAHVLADDGLIRDVVWRTLDLNREYPKAVLTIQPWRNGEKPDSLSPVQQ